jgi:hypothetical protein
VHVFLKKSTPRNAAYFITSAVAIDVSAHLVDVDIALAWVLTPRAMPARGMGSIITGGTSRATRLDIRMAATTVAAAFPTAMETILPVYWKISSRAAMTGYRCLRPTDRIRCVHARGIPVVRPCNDIN